MNSTKRLAPLVIALLAALVVTGCAGAGEAANGERVSTPVKVLDATPTPGGPAGSKNVAGTPMDGGDTAGEEGTGAAGAPAENGETDSTFDLATWEQHRFHEDWEFGYPPGWQVDRPGDGNVVLSGELEGGQFLVDIARVFDSSAILPEEWVNGELTRLNGENQRNLSVTDLEVAGDSAKRVRGLLLADVPGVESEAYGMRLECPVERAYVWDKGDGGNGLLVITTVQTGEGDCNPELLGRLMDTLLAEVSG